MINFIDGLSVPVCVDTTGAQARKARTNVGGSDRGASD
jgi:hypothetical protein